MTENKRNYILAAVLIVVAGLLKVFTFPGSINPIIAIALFSGAIFSDKRMAFAWPLFAMLFSDILMEVSNVAPGFYGWGQLANYVCLMAVTGLGFFMKKINIASVAGFSIGSTILFFFLSNSAVYLTGGYVYYGGGVSGFINCLAAGVPFMVKRIPIDLVFSAIFFGSYYYMMSKQAVAVRVNKKD